MVTVLLLVLWKSAKEQVTLMVPGKHPGDPSLALVTGQGPGSKQKGIWRSGWAEEGLMHFFYVVSLPRPAQECTCSPSEKYG